MLHEMSVSEDTINHEMNIIANYVNQISRGINTLLAQIDLTDEATMTTAQELLKRQAFLQSTLRFLTDIAIQPAN